MASKILLFLTIILVVSVCSVTCQYPLGAGLTPGGYMPPPIVITRNCGNGNDKDMLYLLLLLLLDNNGN
ncbi:hypothetical protein evm_011347 [Chilo suppressalis]|nr:hypothetical protein evm_011347 [Chilo suppressalis]